MSIFGMQRRVAFGLCALLGVTPAIAAETVALAASTPGGPRVIVQSEPVMQLVVGGAVNHPLLAAVILVAAIAFVLFILRQRQTERDTPDQPEPPAVPSAWPKSFKPKAVAGHFPGRTDILATSAEPGTPAITSRAANTPKAANTQKAVPTPKAAIATSAVAAAPVSASMAFDWPGAANDESVADKAAELIKGAASTSALPKPVAAPVKSASRPAIALNSLQLRLRDRYISVRFPGVAKSSQDLEASGQVVKAARLYFEDDQPRRAVELLELAIEQHPEEEALWLALIEILFLVRMRNDFCKVAARYKVQHPESNQWAEVARLGAVIAGDNLMFRAAAGSPRAHEHYGPWPDLPNWIQAPWDLTAEVSAADFHARMNQRLAARSAAVAPVAELAKAA